MTKRERRPGGGGAADFSTDRRGPQHSDTGSSREALDPILHLLDQLDAALTDSGAIRLPDGRAVRVHPIFCGYAVERQP